MTTVLTPPPDVEPAVRPPSASAASPDEPTPAPPRSRLQVLGATVRAHLTKRRLVILVLVIVAVALNEAVITNTMYERRQHDLTSQFAGQATSATLGFGDALAVLQIPRIDLNLIVSEGNSASTLRGGPAHVLETPLPGAGGNTVIVGKRSRYGAPFGRLPKLEPGDEIVLQVKGDAVRSYVVSSAYDVEGGDDRPFRATDTEHLTLVTSGGGILSRDLHVIEATPSGTVSSSSDVGSQSSSAPAMYQPPSVALRDAARTLLWLSVVVAIAWLLMSARRVSVAARVAAFGPLVAYAAFQLLLSIELLLPLTR
jgi:LPXTG-site transpeptidase (sortase) family protein